MEYRVFRANTSRALGNRGGREHEGWGLEAAVAQRQLARSGHDVRHGGEWALGLETGRVIIELPLQLNFMAFAIPGAIAALAMLVFALNSASVARLDLQPGKA